MRSIDRLLSLFGLDYIFEAISMDLWQSDIIHSPGPFVGRWLLKNLSSVPVGQIGSLVRIPRLYRVDNRLVLGFQRPPRPMKYQAEARDQGGVIVAYTGWRNDLNDL